MELCKEVPIPKEREERGNYCISEATWRIVETRVYMLWDPTCNHQLLNRLVRHVKEILQAEL